MNLIPLPTFLLKFFLAPSSSDSTVQLTSPLPQAKLEQEIELMKQKAAERRAKKLQSSPDVAMQDQGQLTGLIPSS